MQLILDSVMQALAANPDRKFVYAEMVRQRGNSEGREGGGEGHDGKSLFSAFIACSAPPHHDV